LPRHKKRWMLSMLNKVAGIIGQDTGVGFYRVGQPVLFMDRALKGKCRITPFTGKNQPVRMVESGGKMAWSDKTLMQVAKGAEVILSNIILDPDEMLKMMNLRKWSGAKWVVDIDDDIYTVSADNPAKNNAEKFQELIEACLRLADGVTVSTPRLKEVYKHLNSNIYVNPNGQDMANWDKLAKKHKEKLHKKIRIGWRGASGHTADVSLIKSAIDALQKEYPIELVTLGVKPPFPTEHHDWVGTLEFPQELVDLDLDIALVPLIDKPYNWAKSNIAVQEFGALKIPVVASPVENQKDMPILYAKNNFEWYEQIEKLIKDKKLREAKGRELYTHIKKKWSVEGFTPGLIDWLDKLPRRTDLEP